MVSKVKYPFYFFVIRRKLLQGLPTICLNSLSPSAEPLEVVPFFSWGYVTRSPLWTGNRPHYKDQPSMTEYHTLGAKPAVDPAPKLHELLPVGFRASGWVLSRPSGVGAATSDRKSVV